METQKSLLPELSREQAEAVARLLDAAAVLCGGRDEIARALVVTPSAYGNWKIRGVPANKCAAIERLTAGRIKRQELRPHDFADYWPELAAPATEPGALQTVAAGA